MERQRDKKVIVKAPAKINLVLRVLGRRQDGYHELESLMQKLELADILEITPAPEGVHLSCPDSDLPEDQNNLASRAALAFLAYTGVTDGVAMVLEKNIPIAAGLGGGSSDAAAVLLGLNEIFETRLETGELLALAEPLGADVPFFIQPHAAALAKGIGERLSPASVLPECWIVLVNPGFAVSTKWVYDNFALTFEANPYILAPGQNPSSELDKVAGGGHPDGLESIHLFNDLESVTLKRYPELAQVKESLLAHGAVGALMSGSGPTVFGIFASKDAAETSFEAFRKSHGGNVFLTRPQQVM